MKNLKIAVLLAALFGLSSVNAEEILRMSTTTSTESSGLLAVLNPPFEKKNKVKVDVIAVGSGKALKLGENGDVDIMFVHAPKAEEEFVAAGFGVDRAAVMHNDFVVVGPKSDPDGIKSAANVEEALKKISAGKAAFISRGDDSGTHKKELELWKEIGVSPSGDWYVSAGQGMGAVLRMADDKQAYTLSDRGTFLAYQDKTQLAVLAEGGSALLNPYHIIAGFKKDGQQLFYPDAIKK